MVVGNRGERGQGRLQSAQNQVSGFGSFPDPHNAEGESGPEEGGQGHVHKVSNCGVDQRKLTN